MTSSLQYLEHFAGCRIAVIRALRILFFSFCFVEFLIGMQNVSIQGTSIPVRLVSYMYDMNNALNISVLIFFFLNQLGMVVFTFFFLSYPFNHPRFLQLVFLKTKTNYWATFHSIRQGSSNYYPTAAQCSPITRTTYRFNYRGLTGENKKKSYAKSCWNFKFGASWVIANCIIYLSLSLRTLSQVPTFISLSLGLFPKYLTTRISVDVNALSSLVSTYYG